MRENRAYRRVGGGGGGEAETSRPRANPNNPSATRSGPPKEGRYRTTKGRRVGNRTGREEHGTEPGGTDFQSMSQEDEQSWPPPPGRTNTDEDERDRAWRGVKVGGSEEAVTIDSQPSDSRGPVGDAVGRLAQALRI